MQKERGIPALVGRAYLRDQWKPSPKNDRLLLDSLSSDNFSLSTKLTIANELFDSILPSDAKEDVDGSRVGAFLQTAVNLHTNPQTPNALKQLFFARLSPDIFEDNGLIYRSSTEKWQAGDRQAVLDGYCTFTTLERVFDEETATAINQKIARDLIGARAFVSALDRVAESVTQEGRGTVIELSPLGAELMQTVIKESYLRTSEELGIQPCIAPYYRDQILTTNFGDPGDDPKHNLATPLETIADLGVMLC